jgi:predicted lipoprotein with Yx(FWY)xxD motif
VKKSSATILAIIVIVVILVVGGFLLFHDSGKSTDNSSSTMSNSSSQSSDAIITKTSSSQGKYLATADGKALYTYNADKPGVSNCTGSCLSDWPAYTASGSTGNLPAGVGTIKRSDDGKTQYTYKDMPLYTFTGDSNGQVNGDGVENFSLAKVSTAPASSSNQTDTTPSQSSNTGY